MKKVKKLGCFLEKFTQLTKILHDRRSRQSRQISSLYATISVIKKLQHKFPKMRGGGRRPFGISPKSDLVAGQFP